MHCLSASSRSVQCPMIRTTSQRLWETMITSEGLQTTTKALVRLYSAQAGRRGGVILRRGGGRSNSSSSISAALGKNALPRKQKKLRFSSQAVEAEPSVRAATVSSQSTENAAAVASRMGEEQSVNLSWQAVRALFVASAVPMLGFGFMDNLVMIQAGQYIDSTLGVKLGLATMTAAACGQVVSDVSGVLFGGTLETFINRWMPNPVAATLSVAQRQSTWGRYASLAGAVIGVTIGCALGATTLFFVDLDARDRIQRAEQFKEVLSDMTQMSNKAGVGFPCRDVVVHLAVKANQKYDWKSLNQDEDSGHESGPRVRLQSLDLRKENEEHMAVKAAHQQHVLVRGQRLFAPIMRWEEDKHDEIWAVVEFEKDGEEVSESDIKKVELLAAHLAIFMHRMAD